MTFTIKGLLDGRPVVAHWEDGRLEAPQEVRLAAYTRLHMVGISPTGPFYQPGWDTEDQAYATLTALLTDVTAHGAPIAPLLDPDAVA